MDAGQFDQIEQAVRREMSAEQRVRIELTARETNAEQAVAALLGEKAVALGKLRLCPIRGAGGAVKNGRDRRGLQRFVCRALGCGHSFTAVTGTWLSGMHLPDKWLAFTDSLIGGHSLDWVKENVSAMFIWSRPASAATFNWSRPASAAPSRRLSGRGQQAPLHSPEDKARGLAKGTQGALGLGRVNSYHLKLIATIRAARARTSGEYVFAGLFVIAPSSQEWEPPTIPERFTSLPSIAQWLPLLGQQFVKPRLRHAGIAGEHVGMPGRKESSVVEDLAVIMSVRNSCRDKRTFTR